MDFSFTDEQRMLQDSARRFFAECYPLGERNKVRASERGWSKEIWKQLGELGLLAVNVPEAYGGVDADAVGTMLVCMTAGEALLLEPFLSSAVIATQAIVRLGSESQRERWLPSLASGGMIAVLAHDEAVEPHGQATTALRSGDGWELDGRKSMVYHATAADLILVSASIGREVGLFAVARDAAGLKLLPFRTIDDQPAADVILHRVHVSEAARLSGDVSEALLAVTDRGLAALCAEAFGAMERVFSATTSYTRTRAQFGVPISTFQALRHRMSEMLMHLEQARSMLYLVTSRCTEQDDYVRRPVLSAAKTLMGQAARYIGEQAVQLHGGIGMTDELDVSHYFRRLLAFQLRQGTTDQHLESYRLQMLPGRESERRSPCEARTFSGI